MKRQFLFFVAVIVFASCKKEASVNVDSEEKGTYFSIVQFASDQFQTFWGQPYTFQKVITLNGKTDSSFVPATRMEWSSVLGPFFASDIGDKKYLDQYNFSMFKDDVADTRTFYYEAKDKKLFTKNLQIITDQENDKIKSIYIETEKNGKVQKLFYTPQKLIQIQEYESSFLGKDKELKVEYYFM